MLSDNLRSVVYRSLKKTLRVACEDSNDIVDYETMRSSKNPSSSSSASSVVEHSMDRRRRAKLKKAEEEMGSRGRSSCQLLEVSKGAQKLNDMIGSWSGRSRFDGKSKEIATDLLRGALDLQESLVMLGRLQEASNFMALTKQRQSSLEFAFMEDRGVYEEDEFSSRKFGSNRFESKSCHHVFEPPRVSTDGSSSNRIEELKKVIRDSLYEQNLLSVSSDEEESSLGRWRFDPFMDVQSVSSSHSLMAPSDRGNDGAFHDKRVFDLVISQRKKVKEPNLIAKLMGLESDMPSGTVSTSKNQLDSKKRSNQPRSIFDIAVPKPRKPQLVEQRIVDPGKKTLNEILETMQLKGLLKADHVEEEDLKLQHHLLDDHSSLKLNGCRPIDDEMPPIVIIKPLHFPSFDKEAIQRTSPSLDVVSVQKEPQNAKLVRKEVVFENESILKKLEAPKVAQDVQSKEKPLPKTRPSTTLKSKTKEVAKASKKSEEKRKPQLERRKLSDTRDRERLPTVSVAPKMKPRRVDTKREPVKIDIALQKSTSQQCKPTRPVARNTLDPVKKNQINKTNPIIESAVTKSNSEKSRSKRFGNNINQSLKKNCTSTNKLTFVDDRIAKQTEQPPENEFKDQEIVVPSPAHGVTQTTNQGLVTESKHLINMQTIQTTVKKPNKQRDSLKLLLLSSPSFISCAEGLFNLNRHRSTDIPTIDSQEFITSNARLYLDCANEIITRKRHWMELLIHPTLHRASLDQVVEEASSGIERLKSYSETGKDVVSRDGLYIMLERDLRCNDMLTNGVWDLGWMKGVTLEEGDHVVSEIGEMVLVGLIEELVMDFS
ncbi:hypothetical protein QJS10_CPA06g00687 [Acorus calamus]|uniref:DUF3741 domain-containing protein n=1 Tax=Acorus calamus TaxID=4465 RepID=A0AAV9ELT0_ACOCL|nr:hypothetical protein QJS10_CPA06g00687 [Acorus calamus]